MGPPSKGWLVIPRLPLLHEFSKTSEFYAEWMVNQEKQAAQKLSGAVHDLEVSISAGYATVMVSSTRF